ncbi:MAG: TonB-dependent receptor plug domain-containing protein, partial [Pseudobdellovibrionaceae bacterium]
MMLKSIILSAILSLGISYAHAQDAAQGEDFSLADILNLKVESASKEAEPLSEAPVPVTVITAKMIKDTGVRTLKDALILFVPGMTDVADRNESNFAPRGIYATAMQKVLIMVNGHRLNSRSYLTSEPDYSISLHGVERIEILRGPGSSLYGNVALSGVVNLIMKKGKDVKGSLAEVAAGSFGAERGRFLTGSSTDDTDLLIWGQTYKANGEEITIDGSESYMSGKTGTIYVGATKKPEPYDLGVIYKSGKLSYYLGSRQSSWVEPYAQTVTYNYDLYRRFLGQGPGLGMTFGHLGVKYDTTEGAWSFQVNPYYDTSTIKLILAGANGAGTGAYWADRSWGLILQANKTYENALGKGSLLIGAQYDGFEVYDSLRGTYTSGNISAISDSKTTPLLQPGGEDITSFFIQSKQRLSDKWIVNGGVRYDKKKRKTLADFQKPSPRLAFIYLPNEAWDFKFSYSESFVDAPYWYRYNSLPAFGGSEAITPELLNAMQFVASWKGKTMGNTLTSYIQKGKDILTNRATAAGTTADPKYINSGVIDSYGFENEFKYFAKNFDLNWVLTY